NWIRWNSWNHFQCNIDETTIRETGTTRLSSLLRVLGFVHVAVPTRPNPCYDAKSCAITSGNLVPKQSTFPSGIKALADYVHGKGLKLGIYSDAGSSHCDWSLPTDSLGYQGRKLVLGANDTEVCSFLYAAAILLQGAS
ncbi:hypothetical protein B296_00004251, partial [Ensete ventricosum]